jgi:hypothetical protein
VLEVIESGRQMEGVEVGEEVLGAQKSVKERDNYGNWDSLSTGAQGGRGME